MIPKKIHYVWLSGEEKPEVYLNCLDSWKKHMPEFELHEWNLNNLPEEVLNHPFVKAAIRLKKWAFATDYIRLWALKTYGGIYMDLDVLVFKNLSPFLKHRSFTCTEYNPRVFYKEFNKRNNSIIKGLNIEAAILGAEKNHPWIKEILSFYRDAVFDIEPETLSKLIMPRVITQKSIKFGFKYVPLYQVLENDVHIYPPDTFSNCYDIGITRTTIPEMGEDVIRYAIHLCAHSWWDHKYKKDFKYHIKHVFLKAIGKKNIEKIRMKFKNKIEKLDI